MKESLVGWADKVRKRKGRRVSSEESRPNGMELERVTLQHVLAHRDSLMEEGEADRIEMVDQIRPVNGI